MAEVKTTFTADNKRFLSAIQQMKGKMTSFSTSVVSVGKIITKVLKAAAVTVIGLGTAFAVGFKKAVDFADLIGKTADQLGVTTDFLQQFRFAMDLAGNSTDESDKALRTFSKNLGDLKNDTGTLTTFLLKYNKSLIQSFKATKSVKDATFLLLDVLAKEKDATVRSALARAAAGRGANAFIVATKNGSEAIKKQIKAAKELGVVINESFVRRAEKAKDQLTILATVMKVKLTEAFIALSPKISKVVDFLTAHLDVINRLIDRFAIWSNQLDLLSLDSLRSELNKTKKELDELNEKQKNVVTDFLVLGGNEDFSKQIREKENRIKALEKALDKEEKRIQKINALRLKSSSFPAGPSNLKPPTIFNAPISTKPITEEDNSTKFERLLSGLNKQFERQEKIRKQKELEVITRLKNIKTLEEEKNNLERLVEARKKGEDALRSEQNAQESLQMVKQAGISVDDADFERIKSITDKIVELRNQLESLGNKSEEIKSPIKDALDTMKVTVDDLSNFWLNSFDNMTDALTNFIKTGKLNFKSLIDSMLSDLLRFTIRSALFGNSIPGSGGNKGGIFGFLGSLFSAKGNVFNQGNLVPFAKGGIMNQPFSFPLRDGRLGIGAESGPEAIVPLRRDKRGNLGIAAEGSSSVSITNVFQTTINPGPNTRPEDAASFADLFNKEIEKKILETQAKNNVRRGPQKRIFA